MSRKLFTKEKQVLTFEDVTTNPKSIHTDVTAKDRVHYRVEFSGTPTGTLRVQYSNDDISTKADPLTWTWKNLEDLDVAIGALALTQDIIIEKICFKNLRLSYTNSSGIGNVDAYIVAVSEGA